jgi:hypothetical protein
MKNKFSQKLIEKCLRFFDSISKQEKFVKKLSVSGGKVQKLSSHSFSTEKRGFDFFSNEKNLKLDRNTRENIQ